MDLTEVTSYLKENENVVVLGVSVIYLLALGYTESVHAIWSFASLYIIFFYAFNIPLSMAGLFALLGSLIVQVSSYPGLFQMKPTANFEPFTTTSEEQLDSIQMSPGTTVPDVSEQPSLPTNSLVTPVIPSMPVIDVNKTIMSSIGSLTPSQIEAMTSDTKELIQTQKSLLETVKHLAPVVSQGREMLETFKGYFGNTNELVNMLNPKT